MGAMVTSAAAVGPSLSTPVPLVGSFGGLGDAAMPVFLRS
jgi:hypothetical protein